MKKLEEDMAEWLYEDSFKNLRYWHNADYSVKAGYMDTAAQLIEKLSLVQLSRDQSLPEYPSKWNAAYVLVYKKAQQDMVNDKFKRVTE